MTNRDRADAVVFVTVPAAMGGSNRSLGTLLAALGTEVHRVVASPSEGKFLEDARKRGLFEEHIPLPWGSRSSRVRAGLRIAAWVFRHRRQVLAIHANASRGLNLAVLAGFISNVPIVAWIHDPIPSTMGKKLGPILRPFLRRVRWFAVSDTARRVVVGNGLCKADQVEIVPNPLDPEAVLGRGHVPSDRVVIGFLGSAKERKGFDLLPAIIDATDLGTVEWRLFTRRFESPYATPIWAQLDALTDSLVAVPGSSPNVGALYDQCDIVLVPSRAESFSMVTAEAMLNGVPVVASDLEPMRDLLTGGDGEAAGALFPPGDASGAGRAIRKLASDEGQRRRMGEEGRRRAAQFRAEQVAARFLRSYREPD